MYGRPEDIFMTEARSECRRVAELIAAEIQISPLTPMDTGRMRAGYQVDDDGDGALISNRRAPYWKFVEFGHTVADEHGRTVGYKSAEPHVRPAIEVVRKALR